MSIVLDGTSGITNDSGYTGDGVSFADSTPANTLVTTSGGNVGMGTGSPVAASLLTLKKTSAGGDGAELRLINSSTTVETATQIVFTNTTTDSSNSAVIKVARTAGGQDFRFASDGTERMRIDSSGNLLVGTTSGSGRVNAVGNVSNISNTNAISQMSFVASGGYGGGVAVIDGSVGYGLWAQTSGADFYIRRSSTSGAFTGGVYISNAAGSWSSASDERLKNILRPIENATEKLLTLRCIVGEYKDQVGVEHPFLIAQDVQAVFPEVVNTFGDEDHLGMSYTDMVPILVKAIQELKAINDAQAQTITAQQTALESLTARVVALEGA